MEAFYDPERGEVIPIVKYESESLREKVFIEVALRTIKIYEEQERSLKLDRVKWMPDSSTIIAEEILAKAKEFGALPGDAKLREKK